MDILGSNGRMMEMEERFFVIFVVLLMKSRKPKLLTISHRDMVNIKYIHFSKT
jgi:hypothetical protein